jgi:hypothetical protein
MANPANSLRALAQLRGRERNIALLWGLVRLVSVVVVLLVIACLIDRWIDMFRETPKGLRSFMTIFQIAVGAGLLVFWVLRPLAKQLSDDELALRVEKHLPEFGHRLVTAVQLNRETAKTEGMSRELIGALTREAEDLSGKENFREVADTKRVMWSGILIGVPVLAILGFLAMLRFDFNLAVILLQRQFFSNVEIPHHINLASETETLWPAGDEVTVKYKVHFKHYVEDEKIGSLRIVPEGMPAEDYQLTFLEKIDDHHAFFTAKIPPMTVNFEHRAWLGDGRTKDWSEVKFEPRPVVTQVTAWVQMPDFLGRKPDGSPYETVMNQGEVIGHAGSTIRVQIVASKPLTEAKLTLLERDQSIGQEKARSPASMELLEGKDNATGQTFHGARATFQLDPKLLAYKIDVKDQFGFGNSTPPRRGIALATDEPPHVTLLPERFAGLGEAATDDTDVEGMPIPLGKNIRIAYLAQSPLGIRAARLVYRVNEGEWSYLNLKEVKATEETGDFNLQTGAFAKSKLEDEIEFARLSSVDPNEKPGELEGGGRFDFKTRTLKKLTPEKKQTELEVGDRVEFYIEVFDKDPNVRNPGSPEKGRLGRSDARIKGIVTDAQFVDWVVQTLQSENKLKQLEEKQKGVFQR